MVVKWTFYDPATLDTYTFDINPAAGGSPEHSKTITYRNTSAPDGKTLLFQGRNSPQVMEFEGTILHQAQYDAMIEWFNKTHQIKVTDDLSREYWIVIESFSPKRERAVHYPYKHSYSVRATILDWP